MVLGLVKAIGTIILALTAMSQKHAVWDRGFDEIRQENHLGWC